jgi:phospholipid transport system transporter-binding protein
VSQPDNPAALRISRVGTGAVRLDGVIGFANAREVVVRAEELIVGSEVTVDLGGLAQVDSATLGVLLLWMANAAMRRVKLRFANAPDGLKALAHLCDAAPLLGIA